MAHLLSANQNVSNVWIVLEVDADHGTQLQVDEEQQDVIDARLALVEHAEEGQHRGPGRGRADGEQTEIVEAFHQQVAEGVRPVVHAFATVVCPFHGVLLPSQE